MKQQNWENKLEDLKTLSGVTLREAMYSAEFDIVKNFIKYLLEEQKKEFLKMIPKEVKTDYIFGDETPHEIYNSVIKQFKDNFNKLNK